MYGTGYLSVKGRTVVRNSLPKDIGEDKPTKGWVCIVQRGTVNDLDQKLGPTPKRVYGKDRPVVQQSLDLLWVK